MRKEILIAFLIAFLWLGIASKSAKADGIPIGPQKPNILSNTDQTTTGIIVIVTSLVSLGALIVIRKI